MRVENYVLRLGQKPRVVRNSDAVLTTRPAHDPLHDTFSRGEELGCCLGQALTSTWTSTWS